MAGTARRVLRTSLVPFTLLLGCATGDNDSPTGPGSFSGPAADPTAVGTVASTGGMPPTSEESGRDDTTMRETTTETPDPTTGDDTANLSATDTDADSTGDDGTTGPVILCGNGMIDVFEECDGANLNAMDCAALGFTGGTLACTPQCQLDKSMCTSPSCGDGTVDPGEECDCGQQGANCTPVQLGNAACTTLPSPNGSSYTAGGLACNSPQSCSFNKAACTYCGDGVKNGPEQCDAGDLGGQSCQAQGFAGGNLSCTAVCGFNSTGCTNCGNNVIDGGEACDGGNFNGQSCPSIDPGKFAGGTLSCSNCSSISTAGCNSGNCCVVGGAGACQVANLKNCVCALDTYCCNNSWDAICVGEAKNNCGAACP